MRKCKLCKKKEVPGNGTFFRIPSDERRQKKWSMICKMELIQSHCICQDHFLPNDIIKGSKRAMLMPNAVPFVEVTKLESKPCKPPLPTKSSPVLKPAECNNCQDLDPLIKLPCVAYKKPVQLVERETQTYPIIIECAMETEMMKYKHELRQLKSENLHLKDKIATLTCTVNGMRKVFTEGQIRKLALGRIEWRAEDMENAKQLFAAGPKTYNYLYDRGYPLPHETTIHRWNRQKRAKEAKNNASVSQIADVEQKDSSVTDKPTVVKPSIKGIAKQKLKRAKKLISKAKPRAKRKGGPVKSRAKKQKKLDLDKQLTQAIDTILDNKDTDLPHDMLSTDLITKPTSDQGIVKIEPQLTESIECPLDKKDTPTYHGVTNKELFMRQNSHKEDVELVKQLIKNIELKLDNKKSILTQNISTNSVIMKPTSAPCNANLDKQLTKNLKQPEDNKDAISFHDVSSKDLIVIPNSNEGGVELSKQLIKAIGSRLGNKNTIPSSQVVSSKSLIVKPTSYSKSYVDLDKNLADPIISQVDIKNTILCADVSTKDVIIQTTSDQQDFEVDKQFNNDLGLEVDHKITISPLIVSNKDLIVKPTTSKGCMQLGKPVVTRIIEPRLDNKCVVMPHRVLTNDLIVKPTAGKGNVELGKQLAKVIKSRWDNRKTLTTHVVSNKNLNLKSTTAPVGIGLGKQITNANATIKPHEVSMKCLTPKLETVQADVAVDKLLTVAIGTDTISPPDVSPNCLIDFTKSTPDHWGDELEKQLSEAIEPHLDKKNAISFHDVKTNGLLINFVESAADQWAVELGKQLTEDTEPEVSAKSVTSSQETSTIGFINFLKTSPDNGASNKGNK